MNSLARATLDQRIAPFREIPDTAIPSGSWIRAIRQALEMNAAQLARRIGVTRQTLDQFERHEANGTIRLDSLQRAAEALNCRLVYALVPNDTLEETVLAQARRRVMDRLEDIDHTMLLENQRFSASAHSEYIELSARSIIGTRFLWSEPDVNPPTN
jgi:predicted DNA-binding mobile mystery protein A